ncbi:unnamed protein product [Brugia timori]|uniref:Polbeta domain-containing protein n=1 Tax=Brugia timori TaxID=42155 RepID=A0A0R3R8H6_9BILA|nr:unnamed protein product [Brugia timori]
MLDTEIHQLYNYKISLQTFDFLFIKPSFQIKTFFSKIQFCLNHCHFIYGPYSRFKKSDINNRPDFILKDYKKLKLL